MACSNIRLVFYFLCGINFIALQNCDGSLISVFTKIDFEGIRRTIDNTQCSNLPPEMARKVMAVNTNGYCARLFDGTNCSGNFVEILARSPSHNRLGAWNFSGVAVSVGPCRDPCSMEVTGDNYDGDSKIDLFTQRNFTGLTRKIKVEGCTLVPLVFTQYNYILSVQTYGHCVQLYNNSDCMTNLQNGDSIELREGTPHHEDMSTWGFPVTKSISHCRYKCPKTSKPPDENPDGDLKLTNNWNNGKLLTVTGILIIIVAVVPILILSAFYIKKHYFRPYPMPLVRFYEIG